VPAGDQAPPAAPRRRTTTANLVLAMGVVFTLVALMWFLVPRPTSVPRPSVDLTSAAVAARPRVGFEPAVVVPAGWTVTSADVRVDSGGLATWTVNYLTVAGRYVGLMQAPGWTARWQSSLTQGGTPQGELVIGGRAWTVLLKPEKEITSLMLREPSLTTLVLAKSGGTADARVLAESLRSDR